MMTKFTYLVCLSYVIATLQAPSVAAVGGFFRRLLPQNEAGDWAVEAQRNLSRWESELLRHTIARVNASHNFGVVPFELFNPVVTCPPPSKLMRLDPGGPVEKPHRWVDGSKWMCVPFPRTARPGCVVLSFGSNDQFEFEQAALDMTPCTVHTFDCTTGMLGNATRFESIDPARHAFHPYCVGSREMVAANPKQMLNWEGLLKVVRPVGPAAQGVTPGRGRWLVEEKGAAAVAATRQGAGARELSTADPLASLERRDGVLENPLQQQQQQHVSEDEEVQEARGHPRHASSPHTLLRLQHSSHGSSSRGDGSSSSRQREDDREDASDHGAASAAASASAARRLQRLGFWGGAGGGGGGGGGGGRRHRRREPGGPEVFILKIDVEGFEWQLLSEWGPHTPGLPAFIAIEIHNWIESYVLLPPSPPAPPPPPPPAPPRSGLGWWLWGRRAAEAAERTARKAAREARHAALLDQWSRRQRVLVGELSLMFLHLARLGYAIVSREDNPNGDINARLCCAEFLFIRVRGPEEGRPGRWDWTHWFSDFKEGLVRGVRGGAGARRRRGE